MTQIPRIQISPLFSILLSFSSLFFISSAGPPQNQYFINCGSDTNLHFNGRDFVGDLNSTSFSFNTKHSSTEKDQNPTSNSLPSLYQSARIFKRSSSYEFDVIKTGIYIVRLHFFAFASSVYLSTALFNVSAFGMLERSSGITLLSKFSVQNTNNSAPEVEEFVLFIKTNRFSIYFIPQDSSFSFVNAIEVFLVPVEGIFIPEDVLCFVPPGRQNNITGVLRTIYRINVAGGTITPKDDLLGRRWAPDDDFLDNPNAAKIQSRSVNQIGEDKYFAPNEVYETAKVMKSNNFSNITWNFGVSRKTQFFIRSHFYDVVGPSPGALFFNLSMDDSYTVTIDPVDNSTKFDTPFYEDVIAHTYEEEVLSITIGPNKESPVRNAYLNGVEIMEIKNSFVLVPVSGRGKGKLVLIVVGSVLGGVLICSLIVVVLLGLKRRRHKQNDNSNWTPLPWYKGGSSHSRATDHTTNSVGYNLNLGLRIPFADIQLATKNFNEKMLIGKGGFGNVYRGILRNGTEVAVKRGERGSGQGLSEFQTEITVLSKIRHRHLVSLIGYCDEEFEMILVYEFMERGTLREHLYDSKLPPLSWKQRLEICIGAARGLQYLHSGSKGVIIHRDVKSTNILLDKDHLAKVADFGLSRSGRLDQAHITTNIKGTFGYLDPEYLLSQQLTEKSDVYAFGVVLLEVLCARPAIDTSLPMEEVNLAEWGVLQVNKGQLEQIIDPRLSGQIAPRSLRKFGETIAKCLEERGADRPSMGDVVWDLEYALQLQQVINHREPHEDSATMGSSAFSSSKLHHLPFIDSPGHRNHFPFLGDETSEFASSEVFSQLNITNAR